MAKSTEIFIQVKKQSFGPFTEQELLEHIQGGEVPFSAWVYRDEGWKLLAESADLRATHPEYSEAPTAAPSASKAKDDLSVLAPKPVSYEGGGTVSAEPVWFVIRDKKKFGPFASAELVGQLQRKQLDGNAFVWRPGFTTWQKMSSVAEFSRENMKRIASDSAGVDVIVKRKFSRSPYEVDVVAHDNKRAIEGKTMVIGEGGLFLATPRPSHNIGSRLKLHFREGSTPSFNAVAEVVSVVRGSMPGYCMRFVALSDADRKRISKLVSETKRRS